MMELLIKYGADFNAIDSPDHPEGIIAAMFNDGDAHVEVVRWLLKHGAIINREWQGKLRCSSLEKAAICGALEGARLLVEHGAILNSLTKINKTPLDLAVLNGHPEVAEYLRSQGALHFWQVLGLPPPLPPKEPETIAMYYSQYVGERDPNALQEIVPTGWPLRIHRVQYDDSDIFLMTDGMSERAMTKPDGYEHGQFAEVAVRLPRDWPLDVESLDDVKNRWPVDWLRKVARWPFENNTWLGVATVFANGDPPEPISPDTKQSSILLVPAGDAIRSWNRPDGTRVVFYLLYPIYAEEAAFEREHGSKALLERFRDRDVPMHFDPHRKNLGLRDMYDVDDDDSASSAP